MGTKPLIAAAVVSFVMATGVLVYLGRDTAPDMAGQSGSIDASTGADDISGRPTSGAGDSNEPATSASPAPSERADSLVPMAALEPGETPPQFVIFAFSDVGSHEAWQELLPAFDAEDARFTAFLTGTFLIDNDHADAYTGPGHDSGVASLGFGGAKQDVFAAAGDLREAYLAGHEIGTHYNGHFCAGSNPSGNEWSSADWTSELDQFSGFVDDWQTINGYTDAPDLGFDSADITGSWAPCFDGELKQLVPAWKSHGITYDSSQNLYSGLGWPKQVDGVWRFQKPYVYSPSFKRKVTAVDYNMWATFNDAQDDPASAAQLRSFVVRTYDYMFDEAYHGNRAPVVIANHFNDWDGGALTQAAIEFMTDTCGKSDVYCATYSDVVAWMELQDPDVLADFQSQPLVATRP